MSNRRILTTLLTSFGILAASLLCAQVRIPTTRIEPITRTEGRELVQSWSADRGLVSRAGSVGRGDDTELSVPVFVVDRGSASGLTTLFSVQADPDFTTSVDLFYADVFGFTFLEESYTLFPGEVLTVNIRDKFPPRIFGDLAVGIVVIESSHLVNGDFYRVDPGSNFAQGDGLAAPSDHCAVEDVRFGVGGIFDDTLMDYTFLQVTMPWMEGETAAVVDIFDEQGNFFRTFELVIDEPSLVAGAISVLDVYDQIGHGPSFGYFRFYWNPDTVDSGLTFASTSADGRFSVGLQGACRVFP